VWHRVVKFKHDGVALRRCYRNNRHDRWWKQLRRRCARMAKRSERQGLKRWMAEQASDLP